MLKSASIFKDFIITANANNTAVTFQKVEPLTVNAKNDNFSQQVQIYDADNTTDLFNYKYITFDDSAIFEIKDCIKNEKFTTLFIQYLSNIKFNAADNNFRVDAVSVNNLRRLGLDVNELFKIFGNNTELKRINTVVKPNPFNSANINKYYYAIKLRFSELPQNLTKKPTGSGNTLADATRTNFFNKIFDMSLSQYDTFPSSENEFNSADNAISVFLPIPHNVNGFIFSFNPSDATPYQYHTYDFIKTLSELITDLTLSAEITLLSAKSIMLRAENNFFSIISNPTLARIVLPSYSNATYFNDILECVRTTATGGALCLIVGLQPGKNSFMEVFDYFQLDLNLPANGTYLPVTAEILGNKIDLSTLRNNYLILKRLQGRTRVYTDIERNQYTDITTTFEFSKSAYSNYEAYQKSNLDMLTRQQNITLKQQQKQQRDLQTLQTAKSGFNTALSSISAFATGDVSGGITSLIGGAANIAADEIKANMQKQNETANLNLAQQQATERARATILPSSELKGSLTLSDVIKINLNEDYLLSAIIFVTVEYVEISTLLLPILERYIFDNILLDKITSINQIVKPAWQTLNNYYQVKICNRSSLNTRKDFLIYVEDAQ